MNIRIKATPAEKIVRSFSAAENDNAEPRPQGRKPAKNPTNHPIKKTNPATAERQAVKTTDKKSRKKKKTPSSTATPNTPQKRTQTQNA